MNEQGFSLQTTNSAPSIKSKKEHATRAFRHRTAAPYLYHRHSTVEIPTPSFESGRPRDTSLQITKCSFVSIAVMSHSAILFSVVSHAFDNHFYDRDRVDANRLEFSGWPPFYKRKGFHGY